MGRLKKDIFKVAGQKLSSRLIVGTGKYKSFSETADTCLEDPPEEITIKSASWDLPFKEIQTISKSFSVSRKSIISETNSFTLGTIFL